MGSGFDYTGRIHWIMHMSKSCAIRTDNAVGSLGCGYSDKNWSFTFRTYSQHFPSFEQFDNWVHLACAIRATGLDLAYDREFDSFSSVLTNPINPQVDEDLFSFGHPVGMPVSFH